MAMDLRSAISKVNQRGMLLVFPLANKREPRSLWSEFFPRTPMRWEWDDSGDTRVADLWHLRERLSTSRKVIYSKWYRGRATVMSLELARALLVYFAAADASSLKFQARDALDLLNEDSPLSTKMLKTALDLRGRESERIYNAALKPLWARLMIVVFGEVDEGSFPSIAIGATATLFEELWRESQELSRAQALEVIDHYLPAGSSFRKYADQVARGLADQALELER